MKYTVIDCEQRSDEWRKARAGRLTGSRAADAFAKVKSGGWSTSRRDAILTLALEQLTGQPEEEGFQGADMKRGLEKEPYIWAAYEARTGEIVEKSGFLVCDSIMAGCSLDGHIGNMVGILEGKAPKSATHLKYLRAGVVPDEYRPQCRHNLWVTGAEWCDFISWDDRFPPDMQLFIKRMTRTEAELPAYESDVTRFLAEVAIELKGLKEMRGAA